MNTDDSAMCRPTVGLAIPTLNAGERWSESLAEISQQSLKPDRLLDIDSNSDDATPDLAASAGFEVIAIERSDFNHGGTRQWAAAHLTNCDVIVFLTQDAILASTRSIENLVDCFADPRVAVAYGRQLPHRLATGIEAHARLFNYGPETQRMDLMAASRVGTRAFFCSNSFAAYRRSALFSLGGFNPNLILGEDMELAARAIQAGYATVYCATAVVYHSHDYTAIQTLRRYFDIGVFDNRNRWMRDKFGSHSGRGMQFVFSEMRYLARHHPLEIPRAIVQTFAKALGYRLGRLDARLPNSVKEKLSMQPHYWKN